MNQGQPAFLKPNTMDRVFNRLFGWLVGIGIGLPHNYVLLVRGRKSGRIYATPVDVLDYGGKRYVVGARGQTQWARNAQASGQVTLKKGSRYAEFQLRALHDVEKPEVLKAYLDRFKLTVQRYFPIPAGSPVRDFVSLASRYPVFELIPPP
jgi:deazaflavin-dependent oxidoreductase (nitroreductase family)